MPKQNTARLLHEAWLRIRRLSHITNVTDYNPAVDMILNECLDTPEVFESSEWTITFRHPSGDLYKFWIRNKWYAFGHLYRRNRDPRISYKYAGVWMTTRYRLAKFLSERVLTKQ